MTCSSRRQVLLQKDSSTVVKLVSFHITRVFDSLIEGRCKYLKKENAKDSWTRGLQNWKNYNGNSIMKCAQTLYQRPHLALAKLALSSSSLMCGNVKILISVIAIHTSLNLQYVQTRFAKISSSRAYRHLPGSSQEGLIIWSKHLRSSQKFTATCPVCILYI